MTQIPNNLASSEFKKDPFADLRFLREEHPITKIGLGGGHTAWLISSYTEAEAAFKDLRISNNPHAALSPEMVAQMFPKNQFMDAILTCMMYSSPPDHTRLRNLINLSFTPRFIEQWRDRVQAITNDLADQLPEHGDVDLLEEYAYPLPLTIIAEILGVPSSDQRQFRDWSTNYVDALGNPAAMQALETELQAFFDYITKMIEEKARHPTQDLVSKLIQAEAEGDKLSNQELIGMILLLIIAGNETTVNLISNSVFSLLTHPDQFEILKQDLSLVKPAIEELLRFQGPIFNSSERWVSEDMEIQGQQLKRGDLVYISVASANRDESHFHQADTLDITRKEAQHLSFGKGIHYCLGSPLARMEGQIALTTLIQKRPNLRLSVSPEELIWRPGSVTRGLMTLPVTL